MKRIFLINPPFERLKGIQARYYPIGLGYLAAVLEENSFHVRIYNAEMGHPDEKIEQLRIEDAVSYHSKYIENLNNSEYYIWKEIKEKIEDFRPDIVGIGVMTAKYGASAKISHICKTVNKDILVVWGGPHPTLLPDECLENQNVDIVVRGEGELTFLELCKNLEKSLQDIEGISFKHNGKVVHNVVRPLIENLDRLPFLARELVVNKEWYSNEDFGVVTTSRGCPFRCAYCCAPKIWGRKIRHRTPNNVVEEIKKVQREYHTDTFMFWDDSFTVDRAYTISLCKEIIENKFNIRFGCTTRVNLVDDELLKVMRKAGCYNIDFGIETGSKRILGLIKKDITFEEIENAVKLCRRNNINWNAFFMIGFPRETKQDIIDSMEYFKKIRPSEASLSIFTPYPGTELFNVVKDFGLIKNKVDWSNYSHHSSENSFVKDITKKELDEFYQRFNSLIRKQRKSFSARFYMRKALFFFYLSHPKFLLSKIIQKMRSLIM